MFIILAFVSIFFGNEGISGGVTPIEAYTAAWKSTQNRLEESKQTPQTLIPCPETLIHDNKKCLECHGIRDGKFVVKETNPRDTRWYPNFATTIRNGVGYYTETSVNDGNFVDALRFFEDKGINHIVMELFTPGGSVMAAWRMVGYMQDRIDQGWTIETKVYGFCASAGFLLALSGSPGKRSGFAHGHFMWHEAWFMSGMQIETPSSTEVKRDMMRHIQDNANDWIASRTKLSPDEIHDAITGEKMFWMTGKTALEKGVIDHLIGEDCK